MLPGDGTSDRDAVGQNLVTAELSPFQFSRLSSVKENDGMQVAVARMEDVADGKIVFPADLPNCAKSLAIFVRGTTPSWT